MFFLMSLPMIGEGLWFSVCSLMMFGVFSLVLSCRKFCVQLIDPYQPRDLEGVANRFQSTSAGKGTMFLVLVALGTALALFVAVNLQPERLIIVSCQGGRCETVRQGPGWPLAAYNNKFGGGGGITLAQAAQDNPFEESNKVARWTVWMVNGPIGLLLLAAFLANLDRLIQAFQTPKITVDSASLLGEADRMTMPVRHNTLVQPSEDRLERG
jgi:hypothetical protein